MQHIHRVPLNPFIPLVLTQDIVIRQVVIADILLLPFIQVQAAVLAALPKLVIPAELRHILLVRPDIGLLMVVIAEQQNQLSINLRHLVVQP